MTLPLIDTGKSAKPQSKRRDRDAYYTPDWATQQLLHAFPEIQGRRLLDPCCGDGRMAKALAPRFSDVVLNDLGSPIGSGIYRYDATQGDLYRWACADAIVTNPPFVVCGQIAWECVRPDREVKFVALLLRATFLEPCEGREWLTRRPPDAVLALPRISFTGGGTDSAPCWWFVWGPVAKGIRVARGDEHAQLPLGVRP